jgi:hypothetical protein
MGIKYNMSVKVGSYTDREGREKNKWQNVGVVLEGQYGPYILLNRYFNPAGVPCDPTKDVIPISLFKPDGNGGRGAVAPLPPSTEEEVDIPF